MATTEAGVAQGLLHRHFAADADIDMLAPAPADVEKVVTWRIPFLRRRVSRWIRWSYCQAIFSGVARRANSGRRASRNTRPAGPAVFPLLVRAAWAITRSTRARRACS
ncbi:hypothetical protein ACWCQS_12525 [Streptomyces sp. NPDC002076]